MKMALIGLGVVFLGVAVGIVFIPLRAKTCAHHQELAGKLALALAALCLMLAISAAWAAFSVQGRIFPRTFRTLLHILREQSARAVRPPACDAGPAAHSRKVCVAGPVGRSASI